MVNVKCPNCARLRDANASEWYVCDSCAARACPSCIGSLGFKCSCSMGHYKKRKGLN